MASDQPVTNGEFFRDGQWYVWCGNTAVAIRKVDTNGQPVVPKDIIASSS